MSIVEYRLVALSELQKVKLRASDILECKATSGVPEDQILEVSIGVSKWWWAAVVDGVVAAVFGVAEMPSEGNLEGIGVPWFLATDEANKHPFHIFRQAKRWLDMMNDEYPVLVQFVDARHKEALQWVTWLGFEVIQTTTPGRNGETLIQMIRTRPCATQCQ